MTSVAVDQALIRYAVRLLFEAIGEDWQRPGLSDTPARVARLWAEFIDYDPGVTDTTFASVSTDQLVVLSDLAVWSFCEHHLIPFRCVLALGYIPTGRILGLSKLARLAHQHAHRLQVQEHLVTDIADHLQQITGSLDVAVLARGEHLCMSMRGIRTAGTFTTSAMHGAFREEPAARAEFLALAGVGYGSR